jgi:hypothetical protein
MDKTSGTVAGFIPNCFSVGVKNKLLARDKLPQQPLMLCWNHNWK